MVYRDYTEQTLGSSDKPAVRLPAGIEPGHAEILRLQATIGNKAVTQLLSENQSFEAQGPSVAAVVEERSVQRQPQAQDSGTDDSGGQGAGDQSAGDQSAGDQGPDAPPGSVARETQPLPLGSLVQLTNQFTTQFGVGNPTNTGVAPISLNGLDGAGNPNRGTQAVLELQPGQAAQHYYAPPGSAAIAAAAYNSQSDGEITYDMPVS